VVAGPNAIRGLILAFLALSVTTLGIAATVALGGPSGSPQRDVGAVRVACKGGPEALFQDIETFGAVQGHASEDEAVQAALAQFAPELRHNPASKEPASSGSHWVVMDEGRPAADLILTKVGSEWFVGQAQFCDS
jgi:hypothetical protein